MKRLFLTLALFAATTASALAYTPWWVVTHPSFQEQQQAREAGYFLPYTRLVAGPYDSWGDCDSVARAYRGTDYEHIYTCEVHY